MALWVNRTVQTGAAVNPNAGNQHTYTFPAATANNVLLLVMAAAATTTPTGWTLVKYIGNLTGVHVFRKTAVGGETSLTMGAGANGYAAPGIVYEFPAGTTFPGTPGGASGLAKTATTPACTGIGTTPYIRFGVRAWRLDAAGAAFSTAWTTPTVEDLDVAVDKGTFTYGIGMSIAYDEGQTAASFSPSSTVTTDSAAASGEGVTFAVAVPGDVPVTPPPSTGYRGWGIPL